MVTFNVHVLTFLLVTLFSLALSTLVLLPKRLFLPLLQLLWLLLPPLLLFKPLLGLMRQALELGRGGEDDL